MTMLTIVVLLYNERRTLEILFKRLGQVAIPIPWELISDDGSTDGAAALIRRDWAPQAARVRILRNNRNRE